MTGILDFIKDEKIRQWVVDMAEQKQIPTPEEFIEWALTDFRQVMANRGEYVHKYWRARENPAVRATEKVNDR